jgi:hypothetical protein
MLDERHTIQFAIENRRPTIRERKPKEFTFAAEHHSCRTHRKTRYCNLLNLAFGHKNNDIDIFTSVDNREIVSTPVFLRCCGV